MSVDAKVLADAIESTLDGDEVAAEWAESVRNLGAEVERLRAALSEAIGWTYDNDGPTPERRDELEALAAGKQRP